MSVWVNETFVLEGNRADIERFCDDVNSVTDLVLDKTSQSKSSFIEKGLDPESWDLYSAKLNKVYPVEINSEDNKYNLKTGCFICNNTLTVKSLNDDLFYTVLKWSCVGMPCSYRELVRKYYPDCRYYYYTVYENGGCETNDVNGRYFQIRQRGSIYFRNDDYYGFVTEEEYLQIMQKLFHNHSLKVDDVIDSFQHDYESEVLFELRINEKDRAEINGSVSDIPVNTLTCPILDTERMIVEEERLKDYILSLT